MLKGMSKTKHINKTYKYRMYPTAEQKAVLEQQFAAGRWIYNTALEQRVTYGRRKGTDAFYRDSSFNRYRQVKEVPSKMLKADPELSWLKCLRSDSIGYIFQDLEQAYQNFFNGIAGYPTPRRYLDNNSYKIKIYDSKKMCVVLGKDSIKLPNVGRVKYTKHKNHGPLNTTATVIREGEEYYFCATAKYEKREVDHDGPNVGLDIGVAVPLALSDGMVLPKNEQLDKLDARFRRLQKKFARQKNKHSNRRKRTKAQLAEIKRHQTRVRNSRIHKATTELTKRYSYIAIEDLKVKNMTKSAKGTAEDPGKNVKAKSGLNRAVLNVAPNKVRSQLEYKANYYGSHIETVDPKHTSQRCSGCGFIHKESRKSQSNFECVECGFKINADINAARNILWKSGVSETAQGLRKTPSEKHQFSATSDSIVSVFTPLIHTDLTTLSGAYSGFRCGVP